MVKAPRAAAPFFGELMSWMGGLCPMDMGDTMIDAHDHAHTSVGMTPGTRHTVMLSATKHLRSEASALRMATQA